ncbi:MAG: transposase [Gemmatimonadota bacterium]|nr:transposase [Gemmatimonadota bacterium]
MWKPFRNVTEFEAPQAAILYDKFHVLRYLNDAMGRVRKAEYKRLTNRADRKYIKGQKYVLLAANKRLNTAYAQRAVRAAVDVPARILGAEVLRTLARLAAVATVTAGSRSSHN